MFKLLSALLLSSTAQAGVIYNWVDVDTQEHVGAITASIEIDQRYWGGTLSAPWTPVAADNWNPYGKYGEFVGILDFTYVSEGAGVITGHATDCFAEIEPRDTNRPTQEDCLAATDGLIFKGYGFPERIFDFDLAFVGDFLEGTMNVLGGSSRKYDDYGNSNFESESVGSLWTMGRVSSDIGSVACYQDPIPGKVCDGGTGRWVLDRDSVVPVPSTIALLGLGLMWFARGRT